jgi:hypothetical protein
VHPAALCGAAFLLSAQKKGSLTGAGGKQVSEQTHRDQTKDHQHDDGSQDFLVVGNLPVVPSLPSNSVPMLMGMRALGGQIIGFQGDSLLNYFAPS